MARNDLEIRVTPSVLDRLIDESPEVSTEAPKSRAASLADLKRSIRRDLEWLLNTRCFIDLEASELEEAKASVAFYGLPDITSISAKSPDEQRRLSRAVEHALKTFEPRFMDLKVTLAPPTHTERQLQFHIEASLDIEPAPEPIAFDTVMKIGSGEFSVNER